MKCIKKIEDTIVERVNMIHDSLHLRKIMYLILLQISIISSLAFMLDNSYILLPIHNLIFLFCRVVESKIDPRTSNRLLIDIILRNPLSTYVILHYMTDLRYVILMAVPDIVTSLYFYLYFRAIHNVVLGENVSKNLTINYWYLLPLELILRTSMYITLIIITDISYGSFHIVLCLALEILLMGIDVDIFIKLTPKIAKAKDRYTSDNDLIGAYI